MKNRNVSVDLFRFLAALSIMFLHTCWGLDDSLLDAYPIIGVVIGRYPVILFFTISGYYCFLQISKGRNAAKTQIRSLLKVYCVWTVVYYLMSFVLNVQQDMSLLENSSRRECCTFLPRAVIRTFGMWFL